MFTKMSVWMTSTLVWKSGALQVQVTLCQVSYHLLLLNHKLAKVLKSQKSVSVLPIRDKRDILTSSLHTLSVLITLKRDR